MTTKHTPEHAAASRLERAYTLGRNPDPQDIKLLLAERAALREALEAISEKMTSGNPTLSPLQRADFIRATCCVALKGE